MDATAIIPLPPPPAPSASPAQTERTGDDGSFAPTLSHAIAGRNKQQSTGSTASDKQSVSGVEKNPQRKNARTNDGHDSSTQTSQDAGNDPTKTVAPQTTETTAKEEKTEDANNKNAPAGQTAPGMAPHMLNIAAAILNLHEKPTDAGSPQAVGSLPGTGQAGMQIGLNGAAQDASLLKLDFRADQKFSESTLKSAELKGQPPPADVTGKNGSGAQTGFVDSSLSARNTAVQQQAQAILATVDSVDGSTAKRPDPQDQTAGLNRLSGLVLTNPATSEKQASATATVLPEASLEARSPEPVPGGKKTEISSLHNEHQPLSGSPRAGESTQKPVEPAAAKNDLSRETDNPQQTAAGTSFTATDTSGNNTQIGQFSFAGTFDHTLQANAPAAQQGPAHIWTTAQEHALVSQVVQNLQTNPGAAASKLVLRLHPEELGSLKIDLQMKDGIIKANIVTQNEQVQQVLEKYIPKLRSVMEQQGISVDEILVTNNSDNVGGQDLFRQDFADNNDFSSSGKFSKSAPQADLTFERTFLRVADTISGVNVTI